MKRPSDIPPQRYTIEEGLASIGYILPAIELGLVIRYTEAAWMEQTGRLPPEWWTPEHWMYVLLGLGRMLEGQEQRNQREALRALGLLI